MAINPEFKVAEKTFENNVAICTLIYTQQYASVSNCTYARPWRYANVFFYEI